MTFTCLFMNSSTETDTFKELLMTCDVKRPAVMQSEYIYYRFKSKRVVTFAVFTTIIHMP